MTDGHKRKRRKRGRGGRPPTNPRLPLREQFAASTMAAEAARRGEEVEVDTLEGVAPAPLPSPYRGW